MVKKKEPGRGRGPNQLSGEIRFPMTEYGLMVRAALEKKGRNMVWLAARIGTTPSHLSQILRGKSGVKTGNKFAYPIERETGVKFPEEDLAGRAKSVGG